MGLLSIFRILGIRRKEPVINVRPFQPSTVQAYQPVWTFGDIERMRLPDTLGLKEIKEFYGIPNDASRDVAKKVLAAKLEEGLKGYLDCWHEKEDVVRYHKAMTNLELPVSQIKDLYLLDAMLLHIGLVSYGSINLIEEVVAKKLEYRKQKEVS